MRRAFVGGAPGVLVSGLVWLAAGLVWMRLDVETAFLALFFGGMAIFPLSLLLSRLLLRAPAAAKDNPLSRMAIESTFVLFAGIAVAFALLRIAPDLAIPAFAILMGARYFSFATIYGAMIYWVLGGVIALAGAAHLFGLAPALVNVALVVAGIEIVFAVVLFVLNAGKQDR
jgi:hypothetical protein